MKRRFLTVFRLMQTSFLLLLLLLFSSISSHLLLPLLSFSSFRNLCEGGSSLVVPEEDCSL